MIIMVNMTIYTKTVVVMHAGRLRRKMIGMVGVNEDVYKS